jgi:hypothetical protein
MSHFLLLIVASLFSVSAFASTDQPKHIISVGTDGLGWSGLTTFFDYNKSKSGIKNSETSGGSLKLNYNYVFASRVMVGGDLYFESEKNVTKSTSGTKTTNETTLSTIAVSVGYNFNDDLFKSWWIKTLLGVGSVQTEIPSKKTDNGITFITLEGGRRFSFASLGLQNFAYAPSVAVTSAAYSKDAEDNGLNSSTTVQINILKFDIIF